MYVYIYIYIIHHFFEGFFEVAIETWPKWDLNFEPTTTELHIQMF